MKRHPRVRRTSTTVATKGASPGMMTEAGSARTVSRSGLMLRGPHFITADGLVDFGPYAAPPDHEEPWPWLGAAATEIARVNEAVRAGVSTVVTGQGADELLDMGPYHLTDLLRRGEVIHAWRAAGVRQEVAHLREAGLLTPVALLSRGTERPATLPRSGRDCPGSARTPVALSGPQRRCPKSLPGRRKTLRAGRARSRCGLLTPVARISAPDDRLPGQTPLRKLSRCNAL